MKPLSLFLLAGALVLSSASHAGDWPAFRGPNFNGISEETGVPTEWGPNQNIVWTVSLPGENNGSPIVSNGNVFVVSAEDRGKTRSLHCFDRTNGEQRWVKTVNFGSVEPTHKTNQYGASTPAADGEHVVVWHDSAGLFCYDFSGNQIWKRDLGEFRHMWGFGGSPIIVEGRVILHAGPGTEVFLTSINLRTGETQWQTEEPVNGNGERNPENKYMGSWSTPVIAQVAGKPLIICSFATRVNAYDPATGNIVWSCDGLSGKKGDLCYTSPIIADDICVAMGGFGGPAMGFRMQGNGNITNEQQLWRSEPNPQRIGSGVYVDGYIFVANAGPNLLQCLDPATGKILWQERSPGGAHWGSTIYADGHLFATDQQGTTHVLKPNPEKYEWVRSNRLSSRGNSTPAFSDGQIFIRTFQNLYCIGQQ
tara:strand:- start:16397 stop:17662 length:1266 start_codon:yes stop_codon:yes gene_type:complete